MTAPQRRQAFEASVSIIVETVRTLVSVRRGGGEAGLGRRVQEPAVVRDELRQSGPEVQRGGEVDRVETAQAGIGQLPGGVEQLVGDGDGDDRAEELVGGAALACAGPDPREGTAYLGADQGTRH